MARASRIAFNVPAIMPESAAYVNQALISGKHSGDGSFTRKCHSLLQEILEVYGVLLTTSCTHALEMAALLLDIKPGDEVIVPAFTFVSTANAFAMRGASIVFCDIRPDTLNMDESLLPSLITSRTRAVVPVHYAGVGCHMDEICRIAQYHGIHVVEDNAHGLLGRYKGRYLGTFGTFATLSFHETKNFSCGEGGALLVNKPEYFERAEIIREKGTDRSRFFRGQVDKYSWVDKGSSYLPSDLLAAFLLSQLESRDKIQKKRHEIWMNYHQGLSNWAANNGIRQSFVPEYCDCAWHMYYLLMPDIDSRDQFIRHMDKRNICVVFHYLPLNRSRYAACCNITGHEGAAVDMASTDKGNVRAKHLSSQQTCEVTEDISNRIVRLPMYYSMTLQEQQRVIEAACRYKA